MSAPAVTQADVAAAKSLADDWLIDEVAAAEFFARHRTAAEAAFRAREAELVEALIETNEALQSALSDMDEEGLCVCRAVKREMQTAYAMSESILARAKATSDAEGV